MKSTKFFISMLAVFLVRVKPASTNAKPGCIKNTSIAASNIQTVLTPEINWATVSVADVSSAGISVAAITSVVTTAVRSYGGLRIHICCEAASYEYSKGHTQFCETAFHIFVHNLFDF